MITVANILDCEQHLSKFEAVIFDLDDTLYSEKDYVRSGYKAIADKFPSVENLASKLYKAFEEKHPAIDFVFENEGIIDFKDKALEAYRSHMPNISLYSGVYEMLVRLGKTKKLGLITDGRPAGQRAKIKALGIENLFDCIIVTDELGGVEYRKPNGKAFELMSKELGVPYDEMVYVGDNIKKDFTAPEKLGMGYVFFRNPDGIYA